MNKITFLFIQIGMVAILTILFSVNALANIYGYIDTEGVGHFSTEKLDQRYQLFMRNDGSFDSSKLTTDSPIVVDPKLRSSLLFQYLSQHVQKYEKLITQTALEFNLEPALLKAVMAAESGFNPSAVSSKGAIGLMQIMPATAQRYGLNSDKEKTVEQKLTDPRINMRLGARYLRDLRKMFPMQQELVLAAYNAGEKTIQKYQNKIPPYPETQHYVDLVRQFYTLYQPPHLREGKTLALTKIHLVLPAKRTPEGSPISTSTLTPPQLIAPIE